MVKFNHVKFPGGERGIRTLGRSFLLHSLSRRAPSASSAISPGPRFTFRGGGSRIRTHVPSPGNGFQDRRLKPLGHPSGTPLARGTINHEPITCAFYLFSGSDALRPLSDTQSPPPSDSHSEREKKAKYYQIVMFGCQVFVSYGHCVSLVFHYIHNCFQVNTFHA
jgi:hypothetical protein